VGGLQDGEVCVCVCGVCVCGVNGENEDVNASCIFGMMIFFQSLESSGRRGKERINQRQRRRVDRPQTMIAGKSACSFESLNMLLWGTSCSICLLRSLFAIGPIRR